MDDIDELFKDMWKAEFVPEEKRYYVVTVSKFYGPISYKQNGDLRKKAEKTHRIIASSRSKDFAERIALEHNLNSQSCCVQAFKETVCREAIHAAERFLEGLK